MRPDLNPDYIDPAIGIPFALALFAYWGYLILRDRRRG